MPQEDPKPVRVVGLGQACVDYLGRLPFFPPEDGKVELHELHTSCGGPASTSLVALARLGVASAFLGAVGDDAFGRRIVANLADVGVDTRGLRIRTGCTSQFAFIAVTGQEARRTVFWHRGSAPHLDVAEVDLGLFPAAEILHLDGLMIAASIAAARQARARGMRVVLDAGTLREGSRELLRHVDVLIASETFAAPLLGPEAPVREALEVLHALGPPEVVITLGPEGSIGLGEQGIHRQAAFTVPVKDTTGAGDVYHGGYLYGLLQNWNMPRCMRFASAVAALKCTRMGAQAGAPDLAAVESLLKNQPPS